jgi:hypothetical protein
MAEIMFESVESEKYGEKPIFFIVSLYLDPLKYNVEDAVRNVKSLCSFYPETLHNYGKNGTYQVAYPTYLPNFDHLLLSLLVIEKIGRYDGR